MYDHILTPYCLPLVDAIKVTLAVRQPWLPASVLYGPDGCRWFGQIGDNYYPREAEKEVLTTSHDLLARLVTVESSICVVEAGPGASEKVDLLLGPLLIKASRAQYHPIDVDKRGLNVLTSRLQSDHPDLLIKPRIGSYCDPKVWPCRRNRIHDKKIIAFLGSSIGNYTQEEQYALFRLFRSQLLRGDVLIVGFDLAHGLDKPFWQIIEAYNDLITDAMYQSSLTYLQQLGFTLDASAFKVETFYSLVKKRVETHLICIRDVDIRYPGDVKPIRYLVGTRIRLEYAHKFCEKDINCLAAQTRFKVERTLLNSKSQYALVIFRAT